MRDVTLVMFGMVLSAGLCLLARYLNRREQQNVRYDPFVTDHPQD